MSKFGEEINEALELEFTNYKDACFLKIINAANIDLYNCTELSDLFEEKNKEKFSHWIIDISKVKYIDSSGLGALAKQAHLLSSSDKKIYILSPRVSVIHLFTMTGFSKWFITVNSLDEIQL